VADAEVFAEVPTARLSVAAVDDCNEPAGIYVEAGLPVAAVDLSEVPRTPA
jgi:hypothetical protein